MKPRHFITIAIATMTLVACGNDNGPSDTTAVTETTTTNGSSGIANPASEYCVAQGGTVELVDEADGQVGYCNLPDGRRIEEWEFYNSDNG